MIITDHFVMLNLPKTGSSFARKVLKELYHNRYRKLSFKEKLYLKFGLTQPVIRELILENIKVKTTAVGRQGIADQHGIYEQIPAIDKSKKIFSVVRHPLKRLLSLFKYRNWVQFPPCNKEEIAKHFPGFPNLNIEEYLDLINLSKKNRLGYDLSTVDIGPQSIQFIQMFFKKPDDVLSNITDDYIDSDQIFEDIADITFLRQENLRMDLNDFLRNYGFTEEELSIIDKMPDVNVTKKSKDSDSFISSRITEYLMREERLIFRILKNKGINYSL